MNMEPSDCSETSVHKLQTAGNHPEDRIQTTQLRRNTTLCCVV